MRLELTIHQQGQQRSVTAGTPLMRVSNRQNGALSFGASYIISDYLRTFLGARDSGLVINSEKRSVGGAYCFTYPLRHI